MIQYLVSFLVMASLPLVAFAEEVIPNTPGGVNVNVARVTQMYDLEMHQGIDVKLIVEDLGGSSDVSHSKQGYLTMYLKGELFDTTATFPIGTFFEIKSVKKKESGIYKITVTQWDKDYLKIEEKTFTIFAIGALYDISEVRCNIQWGDCSASLQTKISLMEKVPTGKLK